MATKRDVKDLRKRLGLSQQALAEKLYVDQSTISDWERNGLPNRGFVLYAYDRLASSLQQEPAEAAKGEAAR